MRILAARERPWWRFGHRVRQPSQTPMLGQKQTWNCLPLMSALPPKADIDERDRRVRFVPKADIPHCGKKVAIRSPRRRARAGAAEFEDPAFWRF
jgi:hypothetical protein